MDRLSFGVAGAMGAAVGFAAFGWSISALLALLAGMMLTAAGLIPASAMGWRAALRTFFRQPLLFEHAAIWCAALLGAVFIVRAWEQ